MQQGCCQQCCYATTVGDSIFSTSFHRPQRHRVTSAVSESWDDDFLFQNEEDDTGSAPQSASYHGAHDRECTVMGATRGQIDAEDDEDVENWDDAFAWNADALLTPSASKSSSLHNAMRLSTVPDPSKHDEDRQRNHNELPEDVRRDIDFGGSKQAVKAHHRLSNSSSASDATDFSARLAAQSDASSSGGRRSQDSYDPFDSKLPFRSNDRTLKASPTRLARFAPRRTVTVTTVATTQRQRHQPRKLPLPSSVAPQDVLLVQRLVSTHAANPRRGVLQPSKATLILPRQSYTPGHSPSPSWVHCNA